jgi:histidine kinase
MKDLINKNKSNLKVAEVILIVLVWLVIIGSPLFMNDDNNFEWSRLIRRGDVVIPLFLIFLINRFYLVPALLLKKKRGLYIGLVILLIALTTLGSFLITRPNKNKRNQPPPREMNHQQGIQKPPPPAILQPLPPPPHHLTQPPAPPHVPPFLNVLLFSILLIGFDTGLMTSFRLARTENEKAKLEKENIENQLAFLRNQISPHFFMNTLNNIHALVDIDAEEAKDSIIKLSKLMRHILYDSETKTIPLKKEADFIKNYVGLMKLRFSSLVKITLKIPDELPDKSIPPLLFISFIENAFKHGLSYNADSFIDISLTIEGENLKLNIANSNFKTETKHGYKGIGIVNARKRLDLLYGDKYDLSIYDENEEFIVNLSIPI